MKALEERADARAAKHEAEMKAMEKKADARAAAMDKKHATLREELKAQSARFDARTDALDKKHDSRREAAENRLDRRMDSITKLIQQGMKILILIEKRVDEVAAAQRNTDRTLKSFIASIRNGHHGDSRQSQR